MNRAEALAKALAPVGGRYGAPMGRQDERPDDLEFLWLARVPFAAGGYDRGGAYWGSPANLYVAFSASGSRLYRRGSSRAAVIAAIREEFPDAGLKFYGVPA